LTLARSFAEQEGFDLELSANAAEALLLWRYPFNVRELRTLVSSFATERADTETALVDLSLIKAINPRLTQRGSFTLPSEAASTRQVPSRRLQIRALLKKHEGNVSKVAADLGCDRSQIYRWMKMLGLSVDEFRQR